MGHATEHIAAWEAAGLIDRATADRLRAATVDEGTAAEAIGAPSGYATDAATRPADAASMASAAPAAVAGPAAVAAIFGPGVSIGEMFGYLGGAFLLASWTAFVSRLAGGDQATITVAIGSAIAAAVFAGLGLYLRGRDARQGRAAGVAFAISAASVAASVAALVGGGSLDTLVIAIAASAAALAAAIAFRLLHPAVLTQLSVLAWLTTLAAALLGWLRSVIAPGIGTDVNGVPLPTSGPSPMVLVIAAAAWWLAWAVCFGLLGLRESTRGATDPAAGRRAAVTRFWAGLVAVFGLASAVTQSTLGPDYSTLRVLEPWVGDLAILVLCAVLVERAFRREASSYIYAAGIGVVIALTDLNATYAAGTPEAGLLIEGLILLGVGIGADRLRRRIGRPDDPGGPSGTEQALMSAAPPSPLPEAPPLTGDAPPLIGQAPPLSGEAPPLQPPAASPAG